MSGKERDNDFGTSDDILVKPREKTKKPSMYKVLLLNDDYTPMEFVIHILTQFFGKDQDDATRIMLQVHQKGVGICGVYSYDVAETKATQVVDFARKNQHPLQCIVEKD
ncbi:ATP-dependent Clp protease adapter ClpS [Kiloniella sp.]|uniref:ATP-dependent Clp protease adapter ClpS n=1 Tax=Kiloniella sp. TaxID=1938587 RepID=UPI003B011B60